MKVKENIASDTDSDKMTSDFIKKYLLEKGFRSIEPLGIGGFGEVMSALSPQNTEVAVKIIQDESSWHMEENMWPHLNHPKILPTLDVMRLDDVGCHLYIMPKHPGTLGSVFKSSAFQKDPQKLLILKKWFTDTLEALDYLHGAKLCHLDLKTDNILISNTNSAILCDFSGLNSTGINIQRLVSPLKFRPPECYEENGCPEVEGVAFDMWAFGLLALSCMTNFWPRRFMGDVNKPDWKWKEKVKPVIEIVLQESIFQKVMNKAFPYAVISENEKNSALDFLKGCLSMDPKERFTASRALNHPFLKEGGHIDVSGEEVLENPVNRPESQKRPIEDVSDNNYKKKKSH